VVQRRVSFSQETLLLKHVLLKPYLMLIIVLGSLVSSSKIIRKDALYTVKDAKKTERDGLITKSIIDEFCNPPGLLLSEYVSLLNEVKNLLIIYNNLFDYN
jgi:hypothetical protein